MQRGMHACLVGSVFVDGQAKTIKRTGGVQMDDRWAFVVRMADERGARKMRRRKGTYQRGLSSRDVQCPQT